MEVGGQLYVPVALSPGESSRYPELGRLLEMEPQFLSRPARSQITELLRLQLSCNKRQFDESITYEEAGQLAKGVGMLASP